jgi:hypothetical protein
MELHGDGVHTENPNQDDDDDDNKYIHQTPPHRHDSEQGIFDRSKNIYVIFYKMFYIIFKNPFLFLLTYPPIFIQFAAHPHLSGNISNVDDILGYFDSPPRVGNNEDEPLRQPPPPPLMRTWRPCICP